MSGAISVSFCKKDQILFSYTESSLLNSIRKNKKEKVAREPPKEETVRPAFVAGWGLLWLVFHIPYWRVASTKSNELLDIYKNGESQISEGIVHVLREQPAEGHAPADKITVGDQTFEVQYYCVTPGYKQTIAQGGVLREGVFARLHHHNGVILKVDMTKLPATTRTATVTIRVK
jgi:hypothetical protein